MRRSEINKALRDLEAMCQGYRCYLPPFCHMTPEEWASAGHEYDEVRDCMLGWDITDFAMGDFDKFGFSLITIRNGCRTNEAKYPKVYAEKLLYLKEGQMAANHFHWFKTEDIILDLLVFHTVMVIMRNMRFWILSAVGWMLVSDMFPIA